MKPDLNQQVQDLTAIVNTLQERINVLEKDELSTTKIFNKTVVFMRGLTFEDKLVLFLRGTTGLMIGSTSTEKVGFLGTAPSAQVSGGVATAGGTYTGNEQAMIQKVYNTLRTFGFLS